ncbi:MULTISPECIES: TonB-dependent receptor domain-containing protein [unclassified Novosphingobium]|uniref:TonB-dependent receptor domain-containing protein n=1 Tax=Novosphingobium TaxID=165696 RepID=UPI00146F0B9D|nr:MULTISPECIES: TonB-dependent receptor [unclassified Novosphingobium]NMN85739.1 outer membrane receptor protein involved in Fe transport [Novosphingobium sp. SG916]
MKPSAYLSCASAAALAGALIAAPALAQDAQPAAAPADDAADVAPIVVTAAAGGKSAQLSSISVSQINQEAVANFTPRSQAEVLRTIPGLNVQDTAGPGGNANIGVRGIPVSTGGSEYVGLQEDGLPVTLFGDIQFGNNDYWVRFDNNVNRVEAVRGGSASTFSSQAPGAVINYVSKTGERDGGEIGLSQALNYRETRVDFDYGGHLSDSVRFHLGGYAIDGNGPTHLPYKAQSGYQIKGNITKDFDDGKGYIRFNFKRLDDKEPTFTSMPSLVTLSGNKITGYSTFDGVDARKYASTGIYNQNFQILDANGNVRTVAMEGIHPVATALGGEFHYEFTPAFTVTDKARWTSMSGTFANQWTGEATTASVAGSGTLRYAAGPNAGQVYTGRFVSNSAQAYVDMKDVGSLVNDLTFSGKFDVGDNAKIKANAGWFHMRQTIAMDWRINNVTQSLNGSSNPVPLDLFDSSGNQLTANGLTGFNNQWGGCCGGRSYDVSYTDDALYGQLEGQIDRLNLDASVRYDSVKASGAAYAPEQVANVTVTDALGSASIPAYNTSSTPANLLNYTKGYVSWSFGALYEVSSDTSVFVRVSRGGRFNADRLLYNNANFTADGKLTAGGDHLSVNYVSQQELGLKQRGNVAGGRYHAEVTLYRAQVKESNYDFTAPSRGESPFIDAIYHSYGVEASAGVSAGKFSLDGYVVYTHAENVGTKTTPVAMPKWTWLVSPSYDAGVAAVGFSASGQSNFLVSGGYTAPGRTFVNSFVKVRPADKLEVSFNVNNLFNTLGYRANNGSIAVAAGTGGLAANQAIFDNSAMLGRTMTAAVRYKF